MGMVGLVRSRIDSFVLGRVMDPAAVGLFSIGEEVATLPTIGTGRAAVSCDFFRVRGGARCRREHD